ncbi:MAG: hypothetical protein AAF328_00335 [Planctomycetota bacterium]
MRPKELIRGKRISYLAFLVHVINDKLCVHGVASTVNRESHRMHTARENKQAFELPHNTRFLANNRDKILRTLFPERGDYAVSTHTVEVREIWRELAESMIYACAARDSGRALNTDLQKAVETYEIIASRTYLRSPNLPDPRGDVMDLVASTLRSDKIKPTIANTLFSSTEIYTVAGYFGLVRYQSCRFRAAPNISPEWLSSPTEFIGCDLRGFEFSNLNLSKCLFNRCEFDSQTSFRDVTGIRECEMDRTSFASLGETMGGLSTSQRSTMRLTNHVADLHAQFSGAWKWGHIVGLVIFIYPYAWFLVHQHQISFVARSATASNHASHAEITTSIWVTFFRYIVTGGGDWTRRPADIDMLACTTLFLVLMYNIARSALLYKSMRLETYESLYQLPASFSLKFAPFVNIYYVQVRLCLGFSHPSVQLTDKSKALKVRFKMLASSLARLATHDLGKVLKSLWINRWPLLFWIGHWGAVIAFVSALINFCIFMSQPVPVIE